jgi:Protein of unknown function (DUF4232)
MTSAEGKTGSHRGRPARLIGAVTCALVLVAVVLGAPSNGLAAPTPRCSTSSLRLDKVGESHFTSHRGLTFALRNVGAVACRLKGYPAVRLLGARAESMPTLVVHFGGPPHAVVLAPWGRGFFSVTFAVSGPCPAAVFAYGMRFVPPGALRRLGWYAGRFDLCGPGPALLRVSPVSFPRQF